MSNSERWVIWCWDDNGKVVIDALDFSRVVRINAEAKSGKLKRKWEYHLDNGTVYTPDDTGILLQQPPEHDALLQTIAKHLPA
jgi:hypothetical protein